MPFISTTHYSLLAALKHWNIKPGQVEIINLQPPAIIAAWQRGDGAYVWSPAVNELQKDGSVLTDSGTGGPMGVADPGCLGRAQRFCRKNTRKW